MEIRPTFVRLLILSRPGSSPIVSINVGRERYRLNRERHSHSRSGLRNANPQTTKPDPWPPMRKMRLLQAAAVQSRYRFRCSVDVHRFDEQFATTEPLLNVGPRQELLEACPPLTDCLGQVRVKCRLCGSLLTFSAAQSECVVKITSLVPFATASSSMSSSFGEITEPASRST